jgi:hypothetical protein
MLSLSRSEVLCLGCSLGLLVFWPASSAPPPSPHERDCERESPAHPDDQRTTGSELSLLDAMPDFAPPRWATRLPQRPARAEPDRETSRERLARDSAGGAPLDGGDVAARWPARAAVLEARAARRPTHARPGHGASRPEITSTISETGPPGA